MANTAQWIGNADSKAAGTTKEYAVANGVTVNDRDFVFLTSGRVTSASVTGVALLGMVNGQQSNAPATVAETMAATGDSAGTVKVLVITEPTAKYVMKQDNVGTTFAASHVGQCFDITGATGSQIVDTSTVGTTGQLECIQFGYNGDNTLGVFIINEHKYKLNA